MEPWLRSEFAIDCRGTAPLINYQQCVRKKTKKYIFCIANKATFCKLITLQTCIVQFYKYLFLQTWHFPVANLVLGRCLLADNICVCQLGLLKYCKHGKIDWTVKFNRLVFTSTTWCFSSNPLQTLKNKWITFFTLTISKNVPPGERSSNYMQGENVLLMSLSDWQENWKGWIHPWQPVQTWQAHNHVSICFHLPVSVAWRWK